jgi:fermentation-respiration switch protein FrsA (DUF1100 family)
MAVFALASRRWPLAIGAALAACLSAIAGAVIAAGLVLARPAQVAIGAAPPDLAAEDIAIASGSGALLRGWLPPVLGVAPDALRPIDHTGDATAAVLVAAGTADTRTTIAESRALFAQAREPKQLWVVEGAGHVDLEAHAPADYRRIAAGFLADRLRSTPSR